MDSSSLKAGDILRCVWQGRMLTAFFRVGREYEVTDVAKGVVRLRDELGGSHPFPDSDGAIRNFELVPPAPPCYMAYVIHGGGEENASGEYMLKHYHPVGSIVEYVAGGGDKKVETRGPSTLLASHASHAQLITQMVHVDCLKWIDATPPDLM
jgi:hypothetical protein